MILHAIHSFESLAIKFVIFLCVVIVWVKFSFIEMQFSFMEITVDD